MDIIKYLSGININQYDAEMVLVNLFLGILPFLFCYYLNFLWEKDRGFKSGLNVFYAFFIAFLWLITVPNTAYLITDMRHITDYCPKNFYDVCIGNSWMIFFFFSYSLSGWILFVYALNQMKKFLAKIKNELFSRYFILTIIPLIALGLMLGLIERYNSWTVFLAPIGFLKDALRYFTDAVYFKNYLIAVLFLYILHFTGDYLFKDAIKLKFFAKRS